MIHKFLMTSKDFSYDECTFDDHYKLFASSTNFVWQYFFKEVFLQGNQYLILFIRM